MTALRRRSGPARGAGAARSGSACRSSGSCSAWRLASKWVALYAIGGIAILILLRSALGRVLIVIGLGAIAASLGYMAIVTGPRVDRRRQLPLPAPDDRADPGRGRGGRLSPGRVDGGGGSDRRRAVLRAPGVMLALAAIPLGLGTTALCGRVGAHGARRRRRRARSGWPVALGFGPARPARRPRRPGGASRAGGARAGRAGCARGGWQALPIAWAGGLPPRRSRSRVYVISYLPWVALGNRITARWPPGNTGQTLHRPHEEHVRVPQQPAGDARGIFTVVGLAGRPEAGLVLPGQTSPGRRSGAIYDGGNLATWWLSIPAVAFAAWQAFRRRSLALALVTIMFAALWLPWARIDRATFQYHYYTALPFVLLALAYFVAEIWHGPSRRTWLLARAAAAGAVLAPGRAVALPGTAVRLRRRREGKPGLPGLFGGRLAGGVGVGPAGGLLPRPRDRRRSAGLAAPGPRPRLAHRRRPGGDGTTPRRDSARRPRSAWRPSRRRGSPSRRRLSSRSPTSPARCWRSAFSSSSRPSPTSSGATASPAPLRRRGRAGRRVHVRPLLPEPVRPATPGRRLQLVPGPAPDLALPVPVPGQHRPARDGLAR